MSFDNVLAVVAASKGNFHIMVIGLLLSVFLIASSKLLADFIKHQWLGYLGLFDLLLHYINHCGSKSVLSINEKYTFSQYDRFLYSGSGISGSTIQIYYLKIFCTSF